MLQLCRLGHTGNAFRQFNIGKENKEDEEEEEAGRMRHVHCAKFRARINA